VDSQTLDLLGAQLHAALVARAPIEPLTSTYPQLTIEMAYQIQQRMLARRLSGGDRVIGKKIGVTSQAVMTMLGVNQPDFGQLLQSMSVSDGGIINTSELIQPKAEGEIAFVLSERLQGPGIRPEDVLQATESVMTCFEIVDSRIRDWKIKIQDTVADDASCGAFVLGTRRVNPRGADLTGCAMTLEKNGIVVATGTGAATMGSPLVAVAWLANTLGTLGMALERGEIILSGSLGAMVPVAAGDRLRVHIEGLGAATVSFR
jgi:2-oxopent-4-enoate/cis-2-oxohex-4-enoate hydratase